MESILRNSGLESTIEKLIQSQTQNVIELEFFVGEKTISMHSSKKGSTFEKSSWIFFFKSEKFSGCLSELGQSKMYSPDLLLVLETILSNKLQLMIDSFLLKRSSRCLECGRVYN